MQREEQLSKAREQDDKLAETSKKGKGKKSPKKGGFKSPIRTKGASEGVSAFENYI